MPKIKKNMRKHYFITCICFFIIFIIIYNYKIDFYNYQESNSQDIITLKIYTIGEYPKDHKLILHHVNNYLLEVLNINIDITYIGEEDYTSQLRTIIESPENFDIAFTSNWAGEYTENAKRGHFFDLTGYLIGEFNSMYSQIDKELWQGAVVNQGVYGLPAQKQISNAQIWAFSKKYVDKYDIPYYNIRGLEDLEPYLKLIYENEPDVVPFYISDNFIPPQYFDFIIDGIGIEVGDKSLTVKNIFETDDTRQTIEILNKYYEFGYINKNAPTTENEKDVEKFVVKIDAKSYNSIQSLENILGYEIVINNIYENNLVTKNSLTDAMLAISFDSKNKLLCMKFLNLLTTDEYLRNLMTYGIENIHYKKVISETSLENEILEKNNSLYKLDKLYNLGEEEKINIEFTSNSGNYYIYNNALGNSYATYEISGIDAISNNINNNVISSIIDFNFNTLPVNNELLAIQNVSNEFKKILYSGFLDLEYLEKYNQKLEKENIDKVIQEIQKQLDEWKIQEYKREE